MSDVRIATRELAANAGVAICEEAIEVIEDISSAVIDLKTRSLIRELSEMKKEIDILRKNQIKPCIICNERAAECIWKNCISRNPIGHLTSCLNCAEKIRLGPIMYRRCPLCRVQSSDDACWVRVDVRE